LAKVLFINPITRQDDSARHVPYGIALLSSIVMEEGHQVQVYDHNAWREPRIFIIIGFKRTFFRNVGKFNVWA